MTVQLWCFRQSGQCHLRTPFEASKRHFSQYTCPQRVILIGGWNVSNKRISVKYSLKSLNLNSILWYPHCGFHSQFFFSPKHIEHSKSPAFMSLLLCISVITNSCANSLCKYFMLDKGDKFFLFGLSKGKNCSIRLRKYYSIQYLNNRLSVLAQP